MLCLTKTKLKEEVCLSSKEEGYNYWRRDRKGKGGGGVLIMVQDDIYVEEVQYGDGMVEVIGITTRTSGRERRRIILTYVPPKIYMEVGGSQGNAKGSVEVPRQHDKGQ